MLAKDQKCDDILCLEGYLPSLVSVTGAPRDLGSAKSCALVLGVREGLGTGRGFHVKYHSGRGESAGIVDKSSNSCVGDPDLVCGRDDSGKVDEEGINDLGAHR